MRIDMQFALEQAVRTANAPGAAAYIGTPTQCLFSGAAGLRQETHGALPAHEDTLYDLASLTKVVATATAAMLLWEEGKLDLNQPVSEILPYPAFRAFTSRHLLTHSSGLAALYPLQNEVSGVDAAVARIAQLPFAAPTGTRHIYSDLGFILLGKIVETIAKRPLDEFCARRIFGPLVMQRTGFRPPEHLRPNCAATEVCPWRKRLLLGEVHDERASALGGVAGHAGLFAPAEDLAAFVRGLFDERIIKISTLDEMLRIGFVPSFPWQGLGWKRDPWRNSAEGYLPTRAAFGHTGWTGTCLWIDRDSGFFAILLSNTCHPSRERRDNRTLRRIFYSAVAENWYPGRINPHSGLDRIAYDLYKPVRGKRIAILTHRAARDQFGRSALDVLAHAPDTALARVYTPEHGLEGQGEAGERIGAQAHVAAAPVTSLYGARKRPSAEELKGVELFLIELQDVGVRYYTYAHTMRECLRACAEAKVPVLVLDRPNPLGGVAVEGPIAGFDTSPVCAMRAPARHGLTLGEIALMYWQRDASLSKLKLEIYACDNWPREHAFADLGLPWTPPSPNIPTPESALLYAGMCLFEGVNLNEGRGTATPFQVIGAPWLDADKLLRRVADEARAGCALEAIHYTPIAIPGKATSPKYKDEACAGIRIALRDAQTARPFTIAVTLLCALRSLHADKLEWLPSFDVLAGGPALREAIQAGGAAAAIVGSFDAANAKWRAQQTLRYTTWDQMLRADGLLP